VKYAVLQNQGIQKEGIDKLAVKGGLDGDGRLAVKGGLDGDGRVTFNEFMQVRAGPIPAALRQSAPKQYKFSALRSVASVLCTDKLASLSSEVVPHAVEFRLADSIP
jgi:hypothetical protein